MITPVNGHILIEPIKYESFIASGKDQFEEIGIVVSVAEELREFINSSIKGFAYKENAKVDIGDKVFFDSWKAAKYPHDNDDGFYWLVEWKDVRAIERNEPIPKQ